MVSITAQRLRIYASYGGDVDGLLRSKPAGFGELEADERSQLLKTIELLLDDYQLVEQQLAAASFTQQWEAKAAAACDDAETVVLLKQVAMMPAFDARDAAGFLISRIRKDKQEIASGWLVQLSENVWLQRPSGTWYSKLWSVNYWGRVGMFLLMSFMFSILLKIVERLIK